MGNAKNLAKIVCENLSKYQSEGYRKIPTRFNHALYNSHAQAPSVSCLQSESKVLMADVHNPYRSMTIGVTTVLLILSTSSYMLRLVGRCASSAGFWWDDLVIGLALVSDVINKSKVGNI